MSSVFGLDRGTPIDRYFLLKFIDNHSSAIRGDVLEVGDLRYVDRHDRDVTSKCILAPSKGAVGNLNRAAEVIIGDLAQIDSLPIERFDCFVCTQTLNFIFDVRSAIRGAYRMLRPGGRFIGSVAGISQVSRYDMNRWGDYWRFTTLSVRHLLNEGFGREAIVESFGNALAAQLFIQGVAVEELPDSSVLDKFDEDYQVLIGFVIEKPK